MNIGIDIRPLMTPCRTGVGEYTYELLNAIFAIDKTNQYFLFYNSSADVSAYVPNWKQDNVHFVASRWPNKLFNAAIVMFGRPKLDKIAGKLDWWFSPNLNFTSISNRTKSILTIHDLSFKFFPDCFSPKDRLWHSSVRPARQINRADIILTPSENTKRDVIDFSGVEEKKVKVIYPGVSSMFNEQKTINNEQYLTIKNKYNLPDKYILYLGSVESRKNIFAIIAAYKKSLLFIDHCSLVIAGPIGWHGRDIVEKITAINGDKAISDKAIACTPMRRDDIKYIGYVSAEEKAALYAGAKLFVYPSLYEGFGFPVVEAMASGVPVITSNRSSLPEVAGTAAYLVNPINVSDIARGIELLLTDENLRAKYIDAGRIQAREFSWDKAAREWLDILNLGQ